MKSSKNIALLANAPIPKALLKLGIPTMIGLMVSALYNVVDTFFVGTLGTSQQAAVSAVFPLSMIMLGIGLLFGCGGGSYLARTLGKGDKKRADECASTALTLASICGVVIAVLMLIFINPLLRMLGCTDTMMPYAREYAIPFIIGLVINVFNSCINNLTTSEGQPIYSMRAMLLGGVLNMVLDPLFIIVLHMGVFGAAFATLISRLVSLATFILFLLQKKSVIHYSLKNVHIEKKLIGEIMKIGIPNCFYQVLLSTMLLLTNNVAAPFGDSVVAAVGIVSRIITLGIMIVMGFLKGYQTLVGFNYGSGNYDRVHAATKTALIWSTAFSFIYSILLIIFRVPIIRAFNPSDATVLDIGGKALLLCAITFLTVGFQLVYSCKFMALGKGIDSALVGLGRQGFFFIPTIYILTAFFGINGIIFTQPVADILSAVMVLILALKNRKGEKRLAKIEAAQ